MILANNDLTALSLISSSPHRALLHLCTLQYDNPVAKCKSSPWAVCGPAARAWNQCPCPKQHERHPQGWGQRSKQCVVVEQPDCCGGPAALMSSAASQSVPLLPLCQVLSPGSPLLGCAASSKLSKGQTQKSRAIQREGLC